MSPGSAAPIEILLVEDNPGDVRLTMEALHGASVKNRLHVVTNGEEAVDFLYNNNEYKDAVQPDLILLDLNLPVKDGREVLQEIKSSEALKRIPVIVLTSSDADADILKAYDMYANCYVTKPVTFLGLVDIVKSIEQYWFSVARLPTRL